MRRADREIKDRATIEEILRKAQVCRIALVDNDVPYIVPMNFGYRDGCLFLHSAKEGRKLDILKKNNNVCFEVDLDHKLIKAENACGWSMKYSSVIGFGKAEIIDDNEVKKEGLSVIMEHYSGMNNFSYDAGLIDRVAVVKIAITDMTGKQSIE